MKTSKSRYFFHFIYIILFLLCFLIKVYGQENENENIEDGDEEIEDEYDPYMINILMRSPDLEEVRDVEEWEVMYSNMINDYIVEKNKDNELLRNYTINFTFFDYPGINPTGGSIHFKYWMESIFGIDDLFYDMVILDDKTLLSEIAFMESEYMLLLEHRHPSYEILLDLFKYIKMDNLTYNDPSILNNGIYKKGLYGLPYEFDFDVLYYNNANDNVKQISKEMGNLTWDKLLKALNELTPPSNLRIGLGDDHEFLHFLIEYTNNQYELSKDYDPNFFNIFVNETATEVFTSFYNYMNTYTNGNVTDSLRISADESYFSFLNNESAFFKGRASHNLLFRSDGEEQPPMLLPPKDISAVTEKFLCVSSSSEKDPQVLSTIALQLTSKDMQLYRSKHFGSIPTFDLSKKDSDSDIKEYCQTNSLICNYIEKMKRIDIKKIFVTKYGSPFFEVIALAPKFLRNNFMDNNIDNVIFYFKNMKYFVTDNLGAITVFTYIFIVLFSLLGFVIMFYIYKLKNHPYIKVVSPIFCSLIVFGSILSMIKILVNLPPYTIFKAKMFFCISTLSVNLVYVPMFAVTYRIYVIFKSSTFMAKTLTNKRLLIFIVSVISIVTIYRTIIAFTTEFYFLPFGSLRETRFPEAIATYPDFHDTIYHVYLYIIVSI